VCAHESFDIRAHFFLVGCRADPFFQKAHTDNGKNGPLSCLDIEDHHLAKGLVEPFLDLLQLSCEKIYRHKHLLSKELNVGHWGLFKGSRRTNKKSPDKTGLHTLKLSWCDISHGKLVWLTMSLLVIRLSTGHHSHDLFERNFFAVRIWILSLPGRSESLISFCILARALVDVASITL